MQMEKNQIGINNKIRVKASDLFQKFKHKDDRYNFAREKSK